MALQRGECLLGRQVADPRTLRAFTTYDWLPLEDKSKLLSILVGSVDQARITG